MSPTGLMSTDSVLVGDEKAEYSRSTSEELISFFQDVIPEFYKLKNQYQSMALTLSPTEQTMLLPALQNYIHTPWISNFSDADNLARIESAAGNIVDQFNVYMAYKLPRLKMHSEFFENNLGDEHRMQQASAICLEFCEQMRKTSQAVLDLMTEAKSQIHLDAPNANGIKNTLSSTIRRVSETRDELARMQVNMQNYQANKDQTKTYVDSPRLVTALRL